MCSIVNMIERRWKEMESLLVITVMDFIYTSHLIKLKIVQLSGGEEVVDRAREWGVIYGCE